MAARFCEWTARRQNTAIWRYGGGITKFESLVGDGRVGKLQCAAIGVNGARVELSRRRKFNEPPSVQDGDPVSDITNHRKVV
jgi:hypothetical protein